MEESYQRRGRWSSLEYRSLEGGDPPPPPRSPPVHMSILTEQALAQRRRSGDHYRYVKPDKSPTRYNYESFAGKKRESAGGSEKTRRSKSTICVCGASAYYEREKVTLLKEKKRLKELEQKVLSTQSLLDSREARISGTEQDAQDLLADAQRERALIESTKLKIKLQSERAADEWEKLEKEKTRLKVHQEKLNALEKSLNNQEKELSSRRANLEDRAVELRRATTKCEQQQTKNKQESERLQTTKEELTDLSVQLRERESNLNNESESLKSQLNAILNRENNLNEQLVAVQSQRKRLDENERVLRQKVHEVEMQEQRFKDAFGTKEDELKALEAKLDQERKQLAEKIGQSEEDIRLQREDFDNYVALQKEWIANAKSENESLFQAEKEATIKSLEKMRTESEEELAKEKNDIANMKNELEHQLKKCDEMKRNLTFVTDDIRRREEEERLRLKKLAAEFERIRLDLDTREKEISEKEQKINDFREAEMRLISREESVEKLRRTLMEMKKSMEKEVTELNDRNEEIEKAEKMLSEKERDLNNQKCKISTQLKELSDIESRIQNLTILERRLKKQLQATEEKLQTETKIVESAKEITSRGRLAATNHQRTRSGSSVSIRRSRLVSDSRLPAYQGIDGLQSRPTNPPMIHSAIPPTPAHNALLATSNSTSNPTSPERTTTAMEPDNLPTMKSANNQIDNPSRDETDNITPADEVKKSFPNCNSAPTLNEELLLDQSVDDEEGFALLRCRESQESVLFKNRPLCAPKEFIGPSSDTSRIDTFFQESNAENMDTLNKPRYASNLGNSSN